MLRLSQVIRLIVLGAAMWAFVTFNIARHPDAALQHKHLLQMLATAPVVGFVSVWLCKIAGGLTAEELLPGVALVGAVAMLLDGAALRWYPELYRVNDQALRLGAADLLWGYGVGLVAALVWRWVTLARRRTNAPVAV